MLDIETIQKLCDQPEPSGPHIAQLLQTMGSDDEETRAWTSDALRACCPLAVDCLDTVLENCASSKHPVADASCRLIRNSWPEWRQTDVWTAAEDQRLLAALSQLLCADNSVAIRQSAVLALQAAPEQDATSRAALQQASQSDDPRLSRLAQQALQSQST